MCDVNMQAIVFCYMTVGCVMLHNSYCKTSNAKRVWINHIQFVPKATGTVKGNKAL